MMLWVTFTDGSKSLMDCKAISFECYPGEEHVGEVVFTPRDNSFVQTGKLPISGIVSITEDEYTL